ncbi:hypothetical protein PG997_012966 [Apiospora hydei]|uniref:Serine aminopeptidase S33 domain-containing protein n=1 Tax=Apiospora hydei TaxID=1337664 RepID=A0ABR1V4U6_9PEZI
MSGKKVTFKTLDGLVLAGVLYSADQRGPAVVITPGFNCVKEMFVGEVAEQFQSRGITALTYDPRTLGESEGAPRNDIDPIKQASDYSDALSYLRTLGVVDPDRIAFWGQSFAATVALCAAALDRRANWRRRARVLATAMRDRASQLAGNPPMFLPVLTAQGRNPAGLGLGASTDELDYMLNAQSRGAPNYQNQTTVQTYYKLLTWQPHGIMRYLESTPVLMVIPELDQMSPPEEQRALFDSFPEPKQVHVALGKGHLNVLSGDDFADLSALQAEFLLRHV